VNNRTYTLSSDTLAAGDAGIDVFESGRTDFIISLSGIEQSSYHYTKFVVDFNDGSDHQIIQNTTNIKLLSSMSITHRFNPSDQYITTYNIQVSGLRTDGLIDIYPINLKIGKSSITDYRSVKIIDAQLFTTTAGVNNVLLTVEAQNPRFVGNLIVPYDTSTDVYDAIISLPAVDLLGLYLRTEIYTGVGGEVAIVGEHTQAYFIRENDLTVFVIGNQIISAWSGKIDDTLESIAICGEADSLSHFATTDINGNTVIPQLLLVPEVSFNEVYVEGDKPDDTTYTAIPEDQNLPYK
jgi:hypothetical protein